MYLVCTRLVRTGTYLEKQKNECAKHSNRTVGFMHSILRAIPLCYQRESLVISMVNTWYIPPETYTCVALYLLAGVGRQALVQLRPRLLL
jgi:hypothetical protein